MEPKTAEFDIIAANYDNMFQSLLTGAEEIHALNPNVLSWTPAKSVEGLKSLVKEEINWAKEHLKKNDRIVWYLRWVRFKLAWNVFGRQKSGKYDEFYEKYFIPINSQMNKVCGKDVGNILNSMYLQSPKEKLDHFLSLPISSIQDSVWTTQTPDELFTEFAVAEDGWKKAAKGALRPHNGDEIIEQFPDGWAWWKLNRSYCSEESEAMGHCGNVVGRTKTDQRILSLRQPVKLGKETLWKPFLTFILEPDGYLGEMKGRGNEKPAAKYHPYIMALLKNPDIKGIQGGGYLPSHNFNLTDLTKEQRGELQSVNPELVTIRERLRQLNGVPDANLIKRVEALSSTLYPVSYDPSLKAWVMNSWDSPYDFLSDNSDYPMEGVEFWYEIVFNDNIPLFGG